MNPPTRLLKVDPDRPDPAALDEAAGVLRAGGLVAFPTETVYGLGADATDPQAVLRIFEAKGRPANNPLIVHAHGLGAVRRAVDDWPIAAAQLTGAFWPGPLTLVLPRSRLIPDVVTAGQDTVGVRVPDSAVALALLARFGGPVAAPSANRSTRVSPTTGAHVLKDLDGRIELILDAGPAPVGIESTVLDLTSDPPRLLRPGAITAGQIGHVLGVEIAPSPPFHAATAVLKSPGQSEVHYAPRTRVNLIGSDQIFEARGEYSGSIALMVVGHMIPVVPGVYFDRVDWLDPADAMRRLYETLHRWDDGSVHRIDVILPPEGDSWSAVRDRLWRASRNWASEGLPS